MQIPAGLLPSLMAQMPEAAERFIVGRQQLHGPHQGHCAQAGHTWDQDGGQSGGARKALGNMTL